MKILVHKVDGSSEKDENFIKSIKWTVHPRRMEISLNRIQITKVTTGHTKRPNKTGVLHKNYGISHLAK